MIYAQLTTAIERIVSSDDCTSEQKNQLIAVGEDILKMNPDIKASSDMVTKVMKLSGYMTSC